LYFDSLTVNAGNGGFLHCIQMDTSVNAANQVVSVGADIAFDAVTQNQRYGSSHIGATAKDISNVVTDAASGVVDIFHGIDKAVADTWNNFWKDGKADG